MEDVFGIVGTRLDGKYEVEAAVAEGGFGVVYRATHCSLRRPVAVKMLKVPEGLQGAARTAFLTAFAEEARTTARLDHPAIVRVSDFGVSAVASGERVPWMVLDWLEGETLAAHLSLRRGGGGVAPREALALLRPALEALAWAHAQGVAHRDLKPSNLMRVAGPVPLRVLDFGIAKLVDGPDAEAPSGETRSRSTHRAFSPAYAAPEQIGGTRTGPWTDVHALALVLTEVLTDAAPYDAPTAPDPALDLSLAVLSSERPTPLRRGVDVGAWEPVLARAAALRPGDRYPDAGALLAALEAALPEAAHGASGPPSTAVTPAALAATLPRTAPTPRRRIAWRPWGLGGALVAAALARFAVLPRAAPHEVTHAPPVTRPHEAPPAPQERAVAAPPEASPPSPPALVDAGAVASSHRRTRLVAASPVAREVAPPATPPPATPPATPPAPPPAQRPTENLQGPSTAVNLAPGE